jgi:uncharacterized membrane protein YidH (DUF202 family)
MGIPMRRQQAVIIALAVWLMIVCMYMVLAKQVDFEILFILYFIGVIVLSYFIESDYVSPYYQRNIWFILAAGLVIFGVIVTGKILEILGHLQ